MKTLLINLIGIFSVTVNGQTNVYLPFPDSNAVWNFHYNANCFGNGYTDELYSITISGDTLINGQAYKKLTIPFIVDNSIGTCGGHSPGYQGAVREDTSAMKVFYVPPSDSIEQLLYDFNLQVGDTVPGYLESWNSYPDTVVSIDLVLIGGVYRKRWNINNCYNIQIIEGIGSTYGLIDRSPGCVTDFPDNTLLCFQEDGQTIYPDSTIDCRLITQIPSLYNYSKAIIISPNPFTSQTVLTSGTSLSNASLQVVNCFGQIVKEIHSLNGTSIILSRDHLSPGLYFAQLKIKDKILSTNKIIITD